MTEIEISPDKCDHVVKEKVYNLKDYGGCEGVVVLNACDCGQTCELIVDRCRFTCDVRTTEEDTKTDSDGNNVEKGISKCRDCGLVMESVMRRKTENCIISSSGVCKLTVGNTVLAKKATYVNEPREEHNTVDETINVGNSCNSKIEVSKCSDCGKVTYEYFYGCDMSYLGDSEMTDENGIEHSLSEYKCDNCGYREVDDCYYVYGNQCVVTRYNVTTIYNSNNEIVTSSTSNNSYKEHNYETTFDKKGESCADGYVSKSVCVDCGETDTYEGFGHYSGVDDYDYSELDVTDHGTCGGCIEYFVCELCGEKCNPYTNYSNIVFPRSCYWTETVKMVTDSSGLVHEITTASCFKCGLTLVKDKWMVRIDSAKEECYYEIHEKVLWKIDDTILIEFAEDCHENIYHEFEMTVDLHGKDCSDGYTATYKCKYCDESYRSEGDSCDWEIVKVDTEGLGICSPIYCQTCSICNNRSLRNPDDTEPLKECKWIQLSREEVTLDGVKHLLIKQKCSACGLEWDTDEADIMIDGECGADVYNKEVMRLNGKTVLDIYGCSGYRTVHRAGRDIYTPSSSDPRICEITQHEHYIDCSACGEREFMGYVHGHVATAESLKEIDLSDYDVLTLYAEGGTCAICGTEFLNNPRNGSLDYSSINFQKVDESYADDDGITHEIETVRYSHCGIVEREEVYIISLGEYKAERHEIYTVTLDGVVIFDFHLVKKNR